MIALVRPGTNSRSALGVLACLALVGCGSGEAAESSSSATAAQPVVVEGHRVARSSFGTTIEVSANVLPLKQVNVLPRVPGVIEEVLVDEGDWVEEGQVLARLEQRDYQLAVREAAANLVASRANAKLAAIQADSASTQHDRMKSLLETDAIALSKAEKAADGLKMSQAQRDAAQAQVQQAQVGLEAARIKLSDTVIEAPYAGLVIKRFMDAGEIAGAMPPGIVLILADVTRMKVEGSVNELDVHRVKAGMPVKVRVDALDHAELPGTLQLVTPMVDPQTRTAGIRVVLDNADRRLEVGMSAEIVLDLGQRDVVAVPVEALLRSGTSDRADVFVVRDDQVQRREVVLGERRDDLVEVVEGLAEGDLVVRSGATALVNGQRVTLAERASRAE
jgi:HlyD family secretion protein